MAVVDWARLERHELPAPFEPPMKVENDVSNYEDIPDDPGMGMGTMGMGMGRRGLGMMGMGT